MPSPGKRARVGLALWIVLAATLRVPSLPTEFWLDEIWSWELAGDATSAWDVLAGPRHHHDNNHKLNTLWIYALGPSAPWVWYRLPALAAGLAAVPLAWALGRRWGEAAGQFSAFWVAVSLWMVLASVEARGYGLAVALALLAAHVLLGYVERPGMAKAVGFGLAVLLGTLAHLSFLYCYGALALWSVTHFARLRPGWRAELGHGLRLHGLPVLGLAVLYWVDVRHLVIGGSPALPLVTILGRLVGLGVGLPAFPGMPEVALAGGLAVVAGALRQLHRAGDDRWWLFALLILLVPAGFCLVLQPPFLQERYFLLGFVFALVLLGVACGGLWNGARRGRALVVGAALLTGLCNGWQAYLLARDGRCQVEQALRWAADQTPGPVVELAGLDDFRTAKILSFFRDRLPMGKEWRYRAGGGGAEWLLVHRFKFLPRPPERLTVGDQLYRQVRAFEVDSELGWDWYVYRRGP
jgi:uncharacterized membrane protein